jgi:nucleotide-binding universal stress UspA family protein
MVKTIVVPLDGSPQAETALGPAQSLAEGFGAELKLIRAAWPHPSVEEERYLAAVAASLPLQPVTTSVRLGFAGTVLRDELDESPEPVACMATRGHADVSAALLGGVADMALRSSTRPLVLVGPHC